MSWEETLRKFSFHQIREDKDPKKEQQCKMKSHGSVGNASEKNAGSIPGGGEFFPPKKTEILDEAEPRLLCDLIFNAIKKKIKTIFGEKLIKKFQEKQIFWLSGKLSSDGKIS